MYYSNNVITILFTTRTDPVDTIIPIPPSVRTTTYRSAWASSTSSMPVGVFGGVG